jgi:hypothetical protein
LVELVHDVIVLGVSVVSGSARYVEGYCCPECSEQFVPVNGELIPANEYEAHTDALDNPLTEMDVNRMFEDGI